MLPLPDLLADAPELSLWRRDIHAHPETAFSEHRTAALVAEKLASFGLEVHRGLAKTGVVATLEGRQPGPAIGLRADLDALHMDEHNQFDHRSMHAGKMHACGHDGHTTMLLGAARHLARTRAFAGTVHFIFQPAEENEAGGRVMVEDGLFDQFPAERVFGMHNWPGLPAGRFAVHRGPVMAAADDFTITITGKGGHGAMPHLSVDPVVVAAELVLALQRITSRTADPLASAVVSVTQITGGSTFNVIPDGVVLNGTTRSFDPAVQDLIEAEMRCIVAGVCAAHRARGELRYQRLYPATINTAPEAELAAAAAIEVVGADAVDLDLPPSMGAEDFSFMLHARPGAYVWIGNGPSAGLHNPRYDFNDDILPIGASYWVRLAERALPLRS